MKAAFPRLKQNGKAGFTLLEVLVASAISVMLIVALMQVTAGAMGTWNDRSAVLQANSDARMVLDLLENDLNSMVIRPNQLSVDQEWLVSQPQPVAMETSTGGSLQIPSTWLMFFAPSLDRDMSQTGDIVALSYRNEFQDPTLLDPSASQRQFSVMGLYKTMLEPEVTFNSLLGQSDIVSGLWDSVNTAAPVNFLAPHMIDFKLSWWIRSYDGTKSMRIPPEFVLRVGNSITTDYPIPSDFSMMDGGAGTVLGTLEAVDVQLTILSPEGITRLQLPNADLDDVKRQFGRAHGRRIPLPQGM